MGFHRLTTPGYFGGLPAGYDLINAGDAAADGPKAGNPNQGTYFIGFAEDATSFHFNRGLKALSQNTDALDDTLHRDLVVMQRTADAVTTSFTEHVTLPAGTYLGGAGMTNTARNLSLLFTLRDNNDRPIFDKNTGLNECSMVIATLTGGDAIGGGFSANPVVVMVSPPIAIGVSYRVYYGARKNAAVLDAGTLLNERAFAMSYGHQTTLTRAHLASAITALGSNAWADGTANPAATVEAQLDKIIVDLTNVAGAARIGAAATVASPHALSNGTIKSQIDALLAFVNQLSHYLDGTTPGVSLNTPELDGATLDGTTLVEGLDVLGVGTFNASGLNIASGAFLVGVDGSVTVPSLAGPGFSLSPALLSIVATTTFDGLTLTIDDCLVGLSDSIFTITDTPIILTGTSYLRSRDVFISTDADVTVSILQGDHFYLPNVTRNMKITIAVNSNHPGVHFRFSSFVGAMGAFQVTIVDSTDSLITLLQESGLHWVDLIYGVHPTILTQQWFPDAGGRRA